MKNKFIFGLIAVIFLMSIVSAAETQLTVHTLPVHDVSVYILEPGPKYKSLDSFITRTGFDGLASKNVTIAGTSFGVYVIVKKDGKTLFADRLENQDTQGIVDVYVLVNESDSFMAPPIADDSQTTETSVEDTNSSLNESASGNESVNETVVKEKNSSEAVSSSTLNKGVTGNVVEESDAGITGNLVYIIAIAVILGISLAGFMYMRQRNTNHPAFRSDDRPPTVFMADKEIEEAQRKIKLAQSQLNLAREANAKRAEIQRREDLRKSIEAPKFTSSAQSTPGNSGSLASARPVLRPATTRPKLSGLVSDAKNTHEKIATDKAQSQQNQNTQDNQNRGQGTSYSPSDKLDDA